MSTLMQRRLITAIAGVVEVQTSKIVIVTAIGTETATETEKIETTTGLHLVVVSDFLDVLAAIAATAIGTATVTVIEAETVLQLMMVTLVEIIETVLARELQFPLAVGQEVSLAL